MSRAVWSAPSRYELMLQIDERSIACSAQSAGARNGLVWESQRTHSKGLGDGMKQRLVPSASYDMFGLIGFQHEGRATTSQAPIE
jgi:hypothetical protein